MCGIVENDMEEAEYLRVTQDETALATSGGGIELVGNGGSWVNTETMELNLSAIQASFDNIHDAYDANEEISEMERFRMLLEAADLMERNLDKFCYIEAKMWVDISYKFKITFVFKGKHRNMVEWLHGKSKSEIAGILERCAKGKRIWDIKREDGIGSGKKRAEEKRQAIEREYLRISDAIVSEFEERGHTENNIARYVEMWGADIPEAPNAKIVRGMVKQTTDKLLTMGGLGLGDGRGTYVSIDVMSREDAMSVVRNRVNGILADIEKLSGICRKHDVCVPPSGIVVLREAVESLGRG
jgi:hypothetical protein